MDNQQYSLFQPTMGTRPKKTLPGIYTGLESVLDVTASNNNSTSAETNNIADNLNTLNLNLNFQQSAGLLSGLGIKNDNNNASLQLDMESMQSVLDRQTEMSPFQSSIGGTSNNGGGGGNGGSHAEGGVMNDLHKAVESKDMEKVKELLGQEDSGIDINDKFMGFTALMLAVICGNDMEMVKLLIENGATMDIKDNDSCTILHHAVSRCDYELVSGILDYTNEKKDTALVHAFLLNSTDKQSNSALHYVSCKSRTGEEESKTALKIVKVLKEHGCQLDKRNMAGETALHWAVHNGNTDIAEELISSGSNPYLQDNNNITPDKAKKNPEPFTWQPPGVQAFLNKDNNNVVQQQEVSSTAQAEQLLQNLRQQRQQQLPWQQQQQQQQLQNPLAQLLQQQQQQNQQQQQLQSSLSMLSSGNDALQLLSQLQLGQLGGLSPLQNLSLPTDLRVNSNPTLAQPEVGATKPKEDQNAFSGIEQILREQNRQLEAQILELQTENLLLRDRMLQMESQLKEYRAFAEQQLKLILRGYGVETDQSSSLI
eukprot:TRINITY_DN17572_c0_g3_i1.p1 TRINITY_DN17572_c0_g3~~TRINITY_DN17572_c0_g3_i1.p1  ORF type:complete len:540 (+),score=106.16 TRINITY_DN17572_c0_g3_i1:501-2120(+)